MIHPLALTVMALLVVGSRCSIATGETLYEDRPWGRLSHIAEAPGDPLRDREAWESKDVHLYETALSPAALYRARRDRVLLFSGLDEHGAEPPSFIAVRIDGGVRIVERGESIRGSEMAASWIVASFAGCKGFEQYDVPWFLTLQRRPRELKLTARGLEIAFDEADTGYIAEMPLYGYYKPPQEGNDLAGQHGVPSRSICPWQWREGLPEMAARRCDWWAAALKAFPVGMQESFSVDRAEDAITFRQDYQWLLIEDDWETEPIKFAALAPTLGLAWLTPGFPMEISAPIHDPEYPTSFGPFVGALGVDRLEIRMPVLQYIHEMERVEMPAERDPIATAATERVVKAMERKFPDAASYTLDHGGRHNYCWNIVADLWYCRALPFCPTELRERAKSSLRVYFEGDVLRPYAPFHGKYLVHGPGIGSWGTWGDAGKFSTNMLQAIWAYGHYTGDWDLIRERWDRIKRYFITPEEMDWIGVGRGSIAEMGDEAPPASAFARMAWQVGDMDAYLLGCYVYAKELVVHYVKQVGGRYFYELQPYHYYEAMPPDIFPTNMWGDTVGWHVDSLTWAHGEHQSKNRWVRFHDPDTGRFYRDHLKSQVAKELGDPHYGEERFAEHKTKDDAHILPSIIRLRSLLLDEPPEKLVAITPVDAMRSGGAGGIAAMYSYMRAAVPREYDRVIPATGKPSPFVLGLERYGAAPQTVTVQSISGDLAFEPSWRWRPLDSKTDRCRFGRIDAFEGEVGGMAGRERLSYVSSVRWAEALPPRDVPDAEGLLAQQGRGEAYVIGPFPNANDDEIVSRAYPPEREIDFNASYQGSFGPVGWKRVEMRDGSVDLDEALLEEAQSPQWQLAYGARCLYSPARRDAWLLVGANGGAQAWLNGERVLSQHAFHRGFRADAFRAAVRLKRGWNAILVKVECPGAEGFRLQFRVTHADGGPLTDLRFAATP